MSWFKCSLLLFVTSFAFAERFNSKQCLNSAFSNQIKNSGQFFGLIKNDLSIKKDKCQIEVKYKKIFETIWAIDICREPVHIKVTSKGSQEVYKRGEGCKNNAENEYCKLKDELLVAISDYGLIFAKGERELLTTDHGQTYCTFLLLKKYLNEGVMFSKYEGPSDIFDKTAMKGDESCPAAPVQKVQKTKQFNNEGSFDSVPDEAPFVQKEPEFQERNDNQIAPETEAEF